MSETISGPNPTVTGSAALSLAGLLRVHAALKSALTYSGAPVGT